MANDIDITPGVIGGLNALSIMFAAREVNSLISKQTVELLLRNGSGKAPGKVVMYFATKGVSSFIVGNTVRRFSNRIAKRYSSSTERAVKWGGRIGLGLELISIAADLSRKVNQNVETVRALEQQALNQRNKTPIVFRFLTMEPIQPYDPAKVANDTGAFLVSSDMRNVTGSQVQRGSTSLY